MTQDEFQTQLQAAQDMLNGVVNQRNAASNECAQLHAQVLALQRKVAELEARVPAKTDEAPSPDPALLPKSNGHASAETAATA